MCGVTGRDRRPQSKDVRRESARFWAMIRRACGREHAMQTVDLRISVPRHPPREPPSHERHQPKSSNTQVREIRPPRGLHASRGSHSAARRLPPRPAPKNSSLAPPLSSCYVAATRVRRPSDAPCTPPSLDAEARVAAAPVVPWLTALLLKPLFASVRISGYTHDRTRLSHFHSRSRPRR